MGKLIQCTEAQETWDFEVDPGCDFVARGETEDEVLDKIMDRTSDRRKSIVVGSISPASGSRRSTYSGAGTSSTSPEGGGLMAT